MKSAAMIASRSSISLPLVLAGKNAAEAMPLVQDHLDRCMDCREEFEALLRALRAQSAATA